MAALDAARPLITRLEPTRHPDEVAADLIDAWAAVETALRALLGGSALAGQALVGEVRQRGLLDYRHAHDLLGFLAARDRASRSGHRPDAADVDAARTGFQSLEAALGQGIGAPTGVHRAVGGPLPAPTPPVVPPYGARAAGTAPPSVPPPPVPPLDAPVAPRRRTSRSVVIVALVALAAVAAGVIWWMGDSDAPRGLQRGVAAYQAGQKEVARREFQTVAEEREDLALPRVWLARLAREDGDLQRATSELDRAIRAEPTNPIAQREMGQLLLQGNRPDLAVPFFERAIRSDPDDRVAQGWMACALTRNRQYDVARRFAERAGQGDWSGCVSATPQLVAPGTVPGGLPPATGPGYPQPQYPAPAAPRP